MLAHLLGSARASYEESHFNIFFSFSNSLVLVALLLQLTTRRLTDPGCLIQLLKDTSILLKCVNRGRNGYC